MGDFEEEKNAEPGQSLETSMKDPILFDRE